MDILRRYFDEPEWELVDEQTARKVLERNFVDVALALEDIAAGCVLTTGTAEYKRAGQRSCHEQKGQQTA